MSFVAGHIPFAVFVAVAAAQFIVGVYLGGRFWPHLFRGWRGKARDIPGNDLWQGISLSEKLRGIAQRLSRDVTDYRLELTRLADDLAADGLHVDGQDEEGRVHPLAEIVAKISASNGRLQSQLMAAEQQISEQTRLLLISQAEARHDPLTALMNRRAFEEQWERLRQELPVAGLKLAIVLCDIDHFKEINDSFGHSAGDEVLKGFARQLTGILRDGETAARIGGEEFALILKAPDLHGAALRAEQLRLIVAKMEVIWNRRTLRCTMSAGVAVQVKAGSNALAQERADMALYDAKRNGRNRVHVHDERGTRAFRGGQKQETFEELRSAVVQRWDVLAQGESASEPHGMQQSAAR